MATNNRIIALKIVRFRVEGVFDFMIKKGFRFGISTKKQTEMFGYMAQCPIVWGE